MPRRISWAMVAALLLAAVFVAATLSVMDYPLGVAWDEFVKLRAISTGRDRFYHPLVMIDLAQAAALVVQLPDWQSLAQLARILAGLAGGLLIFGAFSLARLVLPDLPALAAAAATAVTPLVTVHARIFKEDTFVAAFPRLDACRANQIATMPGAASSHLAGPPCWTYRRFEIYRRAHRAVRCRCYPAGSHARARTAAHAGRDPKQLFRAEGPDSGVDGGLLSWPECATPS
ncbi:MAG TPA: hypothetical protein VGY14_00625 [Methyloceanibacter sp.]|jgi:hypothetical protein|nr:hypothetical protein [Methyloceanibacter sp.]